MKNILCLCLLIFLFNTNFSFAQAPYAQVILYELDAPECFPFSDFPNDSLVIQHFLDLYLGYRTCGTDCTFPTKESCYAVLINQDALTKEPEEWCLSGEMKFGWICEELPNGGEGEGEEEEGEGENKKDEERKKERSEEPFATTIPALSPNPSTGYSYLEISPGLIPSQVEMIISDYTGRRIQQHTYEVNASANLSLPIDLSTAGNGLYLVSIKINGTIVKTSKLLIQK